MEILIIFFLIILNGIFSMSEIALVSARKNRLETAAKKGNNGAKLALELANAPNTFLSTVQIGITLIGILTGIFSGDKITLDVQNFIASFDFLKPFAHPIAVGIVVVTLTFFSLVLGELLPKRIGLSHPEAISKSMAFPMKMISIATAPFIWLLTSSTDFLLDLLQIKPTADGKVTEDEIKAIIKEGTEVGEVQEIEQDIVERVFHIGDRKVNSLMTHRNSVTMLPLSANKEQIHQIICNELHSIYPVFDKNHDDIIGVVTLKNIFANFENLNLNQITEEAPFILEQTSAYKALEEFKKSRIHYALICDEYGVFQGIITLNDILEALVGNPTDFHKDEFQLTENPDGSWTVDGMFSVHDFLTYFDLDHHLSEIEVATVSGLVLQELSHIPKIGETLFWQKLKFEIIAMNGIQIDKILVKSILKD